MTESSDVVAARAEALSPEDPVEALVAECLERFGTEGEAAVAAVCDAHPEHAARVRKRLESLRRIGFFDGASAEGLPRAFGRYLILEKLGQGGMGVVYLALDQRLGRKVALKVGGPRIFAEGRARARFEREVRAAAALEHPRIVPIFDVGEAEGVPYFTMQYVEGATLSAIIAGLRTPPIAFAELATEHIQRIARANAADDPARPGATHEPARGGAAHDSSRSSATHDASRASATQDAARVGAAHADWGRTYLECVCRIAIDIADALAHAHAHGVVHRDVKPSNILVGRDGRAQLFDLGLAHLDDAPGITQSGDFAGTPQYVSPEQIAGRPESIDRRTDIYSLGVTLFELLTLRVPFQGRTTPAILRQIQVKEAPLLRKLNPLVPRDLETICLTALEKDPARRYQSADELANDLRRFLEFTPVKARPVGVVRRSSRFLRRNPTTGAIGALTLLVAVGTPLGLLWTNTLVTEQRDLARDAATDARLQRDRTLQVAEFMVDLFRLNNLHEGRGETVTAREILERGAARIEVGLSGQPLVQASLMETVGRVYENLRLHERALPLLNQALAIRQRELGEEHVDVARLLHTLAGVHLSLGDHATAEALCKRSLESFRACGAAEQEQALSCLATLGEVVALRGDPLRGAQHLEQALALQSRALGKEDPALAETLETLARLELAQALAARASLPAESAPTRVAPLSERAPTHAVPFSERAPTRAPDASATAHFDRARSRFEEALAIRRHQWEPAPIETARCIEGLGTCLAARGEVDAARACLLEALASYRKVYGDTHPSIQALLVALLALDERAQVRSADDERRSAGWRESLAANQRAQAELERARGTLAERASEPTPQAAQFQAGISALQSGRYEDAISAFTRSLELDPRNAASAYNIACAHALLAHTDAAFEWLEKAADLGIGNRASALRNASKDADLKALQSDPRFARILERIKRMTEEAESYAREPAVYVPAGVRDAGEWPLLIVLHADGSTKDAVVEGPWRKVADSLGLVLLAPSGRMPTAGDPRRGMAWADDLEAYAERSWVYERPVSDAFRTFREQHRIRRDQVFLAGEGMGAMLAFHIASRSPGLYRGVVMHNGTILPALAEERARTLSTLDMRVRVFADAEQPIVGRAQPSAGLAEQAELAAWARELAQRFAEYGVEGQIAIEPSAQPEWERWAQALRELAQDGRASAAADVEAR